MGLLGLGAAARVCVCYGADPHIPPAARCTRPRRDRPSLGGGSCRRGGAWRVRQGSRSARCVAVRCRGAWCTSRCRGGRGRGATRGLCMRSPCIRLQSVRGRGPRTCCCPCSTRRKSQTWREQTGQRPTRRAVKACSLRCRARASSSTGRRPTSKPRRRPCPSCRCRAHAPSSA